MKHIVVIILSVHYLMGSRAFLYEHPKQNPACVAAFKQLLVVIMSTYTDTVISHHHRHFRLICHVSYSATHDLHEGTNVSVTGDTSGSPEAATCPTVDSRALLNTSGLYNVLCTVPSDEGTSPHTQGHECYSFKISGCSFSDNVDSFQLAVIRLEPRSNL